MNLLRYLAGFLMFEVCRICETPVSDTSCAASLCDACWQRFVGRVPTVDWCMAPHSAAPRTLARATARMLLSQFLGCCDRIIDAGMVAKTDLNLSECDRINPVPVASALVYEGSVRDLIRRMKYQDDPLVAVDLASLMVPALNVLGEHVNLKQAVLVPIPLSRWRFVTRGFNQAEVLAEELSKVTGFKMNANALLRRHTSAQHNLTRDERFANLFGAFALARRAKLPETVILVDDIYTSGATLFEVANLLRVAGVKEVAAVTAARAILGNDLIAEGAKPEVSLPV
ncbi:MAG: ComF family protein [Candidatus Obscuribacterales bacterium]|nr:ComF family protein [Candidatus Obscuribacterales bacterium]